MLMVSLLLSGDANVVGPLEPPAELISQIFPWVEAEHRLGCPAQDITLRQFLHLLVWLRRVLLQDVAMLFSQKPACPVFQFPLICKTVKQAKMCGCAESAGSAGMPWNDQNFIFLSQFGI